MPSLTNRSPCHRLVEMPGPLIVRIAGRDDVGDGRVGMAAEIDAFHAQDVVAAAAAAGRAGIVIEQVDQPFVVEGRARHADRRVHAQRQCVALGVLAVGADHRRREAVPFVERGRARRRIGVRAEPYALDAIAILEARQVAKQRVFQDRHEVALEEHAGRLAARVLDDLDIVRRGGVARHAGARRAPASWRPTETAGGSTSPTPRGCRPRGRAPPHRGRAGSGKRPSVNWSGRLMYSCGGSPIGISTIHSPAGCRLRRSLHDLDDVGHRMQAGDRDAAARLEAFAVGMRMGVEEARAAPNDPRGR